jgi:hypothetical protein
VGKDGKPRDESVRIKRLICRSCGHTHSVEPVDAASRSRFSLGFLHELLSRYVSSDRGSVADLCEKMDVSISTLYRLKSRLLECGALLAPIVRAVGAALPVLLDAIDENNAARNARLYFAAYRFPLMHFAATRFRGPRAVRRRDFADATRLGNGREAETVAYLRKRQGGCEKANDRKGK